MVVKFRSRVEQAQPHFLWGHYSNQHPSAGSIRLDPKPSGPVLLFDDVLDTGSTIREMSRACSAAGVEVGASCVLAERFSIF